MKKLEWFGCYANGWTRDDIVPDAFSHPAKFSKQLIKRIYDHLLTEGYIKAGNTVADPFGGVGLGAFWAMHYGLHWRGCELEPRFVDLGRQNIELWNNCFAAHFPAWGSAVLVQGDSRELCNVLATAGAIVSSPPYAESVNSAHSGIDWQKAGRPDRLTTDAAGIQGANGHQMKYGTMEGQLGSMKEGTLPAAIISSPAYGDSVNGVGEGPGARHDHKYHNGENATKKSSSNGYGVTEGNLGNMPVSAVVGSPPFEASLQSKDPVINASARPGRTMQIADYGQTPGNIGNDQGDTFWQAAAVIVQQCYEVLPPGGVCAWVTGNFRRNGQIVPFGEQWLALCESVGFIGLERITAWKVEPGPIQTGIFGEDKDTSKHRVSFFRRLDNQKNPGNEINCEEVWIVQKPKEAI